RGLYRRPAALPRDREAGRPDVDPELPPAADRLSHAGSRLGDGRQGPDRRGERDLMTAPIRIVSESGSKKVFVSALDWPGWSRSGKTEEAALATLADYTDRYQRVVDLAGEGSLPSIPEGVDIVERLQGSGATDF